MKSVITITFFALISALSACGQFSIDVAPSHVSLKSGAQQQFLVSESNAQNPSGSWSVSSSACGSIDSDGLFTAAAVTSDQACGVSFTDAQNSKSASATLSVISLLDGPAELPRSVPNSSMTSTPAPGKVISAPAGGLQSAFNDAECGDTIQLEAGVSYSGAYTLPAKPCDDAHFVIIRTSAPDSLLPPEGTHINPCYAGVLSLPGRPSFTCPNSLNSPMAKIVAAGHVSPITLAAGANHYRLGPGLEITRAVGSGIVTNLIVPSGAADNIVVDRDWIHGTAQDETTRGVFLSGITSAAIVDSYLNDFHCNAGIGSCTDSQAIAGGTSALPSGNWKIEGNFLEAAAETILFGGVLHNSATPADITIRRNYLSKPLIWMPGQVGFVGGKETATATCPQWDLSGTIKQCPFIVKNLFELKNAQRVLVEGNVLENVWPGFTQHGHAVLLSGLNPPGPLSTVSVADVTIRNNRIAHATSGIAIANMATDGVPNLPVARISVHDDVFDDLSPAYALGDTSITAALAFQLNSCPTCEPLTDVSINHVTMLLQSPKIGFLLGATVPVLLKGITLANSIVSVNPNLAVNGLGPGGPCGTLGSTNLARINNCFAVPYSFAGNVLIGATSTWPAGNFFPSNPAAIMFQNYANGNGGDYHLLPTSPFARRGTDGKDPGADISKVNGATQGVN